jgi:hypothetical protein
MNTALKSDQKAVALEVDQEVAEAQEQELQPQEKEPLKLLLLPL